MTLARLAARFPRLVLVLFALTAAAAAVGAARLHEDDDLLDFIPPSDPDVRAFREVNRTFGALRVALVGLEAPAGDDVFAPDTIRRIDAATRALKAVRGVDRVVSLTSLVDFVPSEAVVQIQPLVDGPPADAAARKALREKVMARAHVVGNFVSRDGRAALMLVFLADGAADRAVAQGVRAAIEQTVGGSLRVVYGGAPFAGAAIYDETQADIRRLTPLAAILILGVILLAFRDPVGVVLSILVVGWAVLIVIGVMGFLGEPFTAASGTLPVILFASGSSYAVHLLGRYYGFGGGAQRRADDDGESPIVRAARIVGAPVAVAGFTTAAGFFSFLVMDIRPMRAFGLECAIGVLLCLVGSLTLVPAAIALWPRPRFPPAETGRVGEALAKLGRWSARRRRGVVLAALALAAASIGPMRRVEVRMEPQAFFRKGSDPWVAEKFLQERFGGSNFLQVAVQGDMTDPATLYEVERLAQFARALPNVTQVQSIVEPLSLVNDAMGGGRRLPETRQQAVNLLFFVDGEPSIKSLLAPSHDEALVHIRIKGAADPVVAAVEEYLATKLDRRPAAPTRDQVAERLPWIARAEGGSISDEAARAAAAAAVPPQAGDPRVVEALAKLARPFLLGDDGTLPKRTFESLEVEHAVGIPGLVAASGSLPGFAVDEEAAMLARQPDGDEARKRILRLAPSPEEGELAFAAWQDKVRHATRDLAVDAAIAKLPSAPAAALPLLRDALSELLPAQPIAAAPKPLVTRVAGEPILDRGLSRSVGKNQERSLIVALVATLLLMALLFRSAWLAFVSVFPSALAMSLLFGAMGLLGVRIDIGTSLVGSIATGAGSDFAMHYLWYLKRDTPEQVVRFVGPIMVISVLLIAAGFAVLGAGKAQPMRMFGSLAALAMIGSALATFLLVPALLRKVDLRKP